MLVAAVVAASSIFFQNLELNNDVEKESFLIEPKTPSIQYNDDPIKVGILHSLTGTMAISEKPVVDATLLAIQEINQKGGILGREIQPIVVDGQSNGEIFAREAEKLILEENVVTVFGGWTSESRKNMKPVFEKYENLLFYPVQYEGLEKSKNIVYTGAAPNQQAIPAVDWAFENIGSNFFLVGSDYVFPHSANEIMVHRITELQGNVVGEEYAYLGSSYFTKIVEKINKENPDVIINTINGDSNIAFFSELEKYSNTKKIPVISLSIGENEINQLDIEHIKGNYAVWNYFQSLDTEANKRFVNSFQKEFGEYRVTSDAMEAAYIGVYFFANAVEKSQSDDTKLIKMNLKNIALISPQGHVGFDSDNQHLWKGVRIGKIMEDGQFQIVWSTDEPIKPVPYPKYHSVEEWEQILDDMYNKWGNRWVNQQEAV